MNPISSGKMCDLCTNPDASENVIFKCIDCGVAVHALCYGIESEEKENWKCSPCENGCTDVVSCELCLQKKGALKQTSCGKWVHAICALFTDGVIFEDFNRMEPVNISKISITKRGQTCSYCRESKGYCCLCSKSKCKNRIHITCAQKANGLKEIVKQDNSIAFRAYCADHKPVNRRLSSGSVRAMAKKMKSRDKKKKELGSKMNANWIMSQSNSSKNVITNAAPEKTHRKRGTYDEKIVAPKRRWLLPQGTKGKFS